LAALPPGGGGEQSPLEGLDLSSLLSGMGGMGGMPGMMGAPEDLGTPTGPEEIRQAPTFPDPEPLKYSDQERKDIAEMCVSLYDDGVIARNIWAGKHQLYDQMFRGQVEEFSTRAGPWPGSSHLHVQMPYWLVDALNARLVHTLWNQMPLVQGVWEEDDDQEIARDAAQLVEWHLQPKRANAREMWSRASKIRLIHGSSVSLISYVNDSFRYRVSTPVAEQAELLGPAYDDETDEPIEVPGEEQEVTIEEGELYRGPVLYPLEWDDVVAPIGAMNLQPLRLKNPGGSDWVFVRHFETLSQMRKKWRAGIYTEMYEDDRYEGDPGKGVKDWWLDNASDQTRTGQTQGGSQNNQRVRQQDRMEGTNRSQAQNRTATQEQRQNPEFEILTYYGAYRHPDTDEDEEMVFFVAKEMPRVFLGGFMLTDLVWTGDRPLMEMHYQTLSNRFYSMGVMEIVEHLSEELDTIHNMRVDVGVATNLPWYFVRASSYIDPSSIVLKPLALVPVDDPRDIVSPQVQNVTSFYHQEETLLLTIIERVMGITDLFLGISPQSGASARHATGFLGTKAEAEARLAQPLSQDAESFAFMARLIYNLEMQWGPRERSFRLEGERSSISREGLTRDDLWFRGMYDFRLGANVGMMSQQNRFQRSSQAFQFLIQNPLVTQDMGRMWEVTAEVLRSMGYRDYEIEGFIGPHTSVSAGTLKDQDEETAQMIQHTFGPGTPAPIHPGDNDRGHMDKITSFLNGPIWGTMENPNAERAISAHYQQHSQAEQQKRMQQMQGTQNQMAGQGQQQPQKPGGNPADLANRAAAQIPSETGVSNFAQTYQAQTSNGSLSGPPNLGQ